MSLILPGSPGFHAPNSPLVQAAPRGLVFVQNDATYELHRRAGRFVLEQAEAASFGHLYAAIARNQERMISSLAKKGYAYDGQPFELRGPLDHIDFSESDTDDPGAAGRPDPRDVEGQITWERAERARVARSIGAEDLRLVDYEIVGGFRVKIGPQFHRAA